MQGLRRLSVAGSRLQRPFSNAVRPSGAPVRDPAANEAAQAAHDKFPERPFLTPEELRAATRDQVAPATPPVNRLRLPDGTKVDVRLAQAADADSVTEFFISLSPRSYGSRFPERFITVDVGMVIDAPGPATLAATLTSGASGRPRCLIALNDAGKVVGLVDYAASHGFRTSIGLQLPTCQVNIVIADELQSKGLGPILLQEAMNAAKRDGYDQMIGYRPDATNRNVTKHVLDLNKPLRHQHAQAPKEAGKDYVPPPNDPFWPPEAWA